MKGREDKSIGGFDPKSSHMEAVKYNEITDFSKTNTHNRLELLGIWGRLYLHALEADNSQYDDPHK